jgi:hypothetical protein
MMSAALDAGYAYRTATVKPRQDILEKPGTQISLRELWSTKEWSDKVDARVKEILVKGRESNSLRAAEIFIDVTGQKSAQQIELTGYRGDEKARAYSEILQLVKSGKLPAPDENTPSLDEKVGIAQSTALINRDDDEKR